MLEPSPPPLSGVPAVEPTTIPPALAENPAWSGWDVLRIFLLGISGIFASVALLLFTAHGANFQQKTEYLASKPEFLLIAQMVVYAGLLAYMYVLVVYERDQPSFWRSIGWNFPGKIWPYLVGGVDMQAVFLFSCRHEKTTIDHDKTARERRCQGRPTH